MGDTLEQAGVARPESRPCHRSGVTARPTVPSTWVRAPCSGGRVVTSRLPWALMPTRENQPTDPSAIHSGNTEDQITVVPRVVAPGQIVIEVSGEVDMLTSPQLRSVVLDQLARKEAVDLLVLSLDNVTFLGTSGLAVLIEARSAAIDAGVRLRLACTARRVLRPLTIAGLAPLFEIYSSVDSALTSA